GAWMVSQGWALAYSGSSRDYVAEEQGARASKRGIWRGTFMMPWIWRLRGNAAWWCVRRLCDPAAGQPGPPPKHATLRLVLPPPPSALSLALTRRGFSSEVASPAILHRSRIGLRLSISAALLNDGT